MGKGATAGDLYAALKDAQQMARAGRELTMRLEIPKDLPQEIRGYLWQIQVAFRESFDKRYMGIGAWMDYLDNRKPSVEAKATEYMDEAKSWEEKGWEICKLARRAAGFTEGKEKLE